MHATATLGVEVGEELGCAHDGHDLVRVEPRIEQRRLLPAMDDLVLLIIVYTQKTLQALYTRRPRSLALCERGACVP